MTGWIIVLAVVAGLTAGIFIGRTTGASRQRVEQLQSELETTQAAYDDYRNQVTEHFARTADLVNELAANSRKIIHHLADGSQALCDQDQVKLAQAEKNLGQMSSGAAASDVDSSKANNARDKVIETLKSTTADSDPAFKIRDIPPHTPKSAAPKAVTSNESVVKPDEGWYEILPEQEEQREKESVH